MLFIFTSECTNLPDNLDIAFKYIILCLSPSHLLLLSYLTRISLQVVWRMVCARLLLTISKQVMIRRQNDSSEGGDQVVEDEFACAATLRGSLMSVHEPVERIFTVSFGVGTFGKDSAELQLSNNGQMWLKVKGRKSDVTAAKLFVKGLVNQEQQQEVSYPGVLHCVFCGARGLFMDCLIKTTSAHIVIGSLGFLLISGLTEPVVGAYSLITDLIQRYEGTQGRSIETRDHSTCKSLDSRRAFKSLVEKWDDRHSLDLLVLPHAVKEKLLELVRQSGLESTPRYTETGTPCDTESIGGSGEMYRMDRISGSQMYERERETLGMSLSTGAPVHDAQDPQAQRQQTVHVWNSSLQAPYSSSPGSETDSRADAAIQGLRSNVTKAGEENGNEEDSFLQPLTAFRDTPGRVDRRETKQGDFTLGTVEEMDREEEEGEGELLLSVGSKKEFGLLLKFFTAMGYTENVVRRVLARTGPREASEILDLVQQEQNNSNQGQRAHGTGSPNQHLKDRDTGEELSLHCMGKNLPSETELMEWEVEGKRMNVGSGKQRASTDVNIAGVIREEDRTEGGSRLEGRGATKIAPYFGPDDLAEETESTKEKGERRIDQGGRGSGETGSEEDFVLGVLKKAAASCGYMEEKVAAVYSMQPDLSTHQLLLELQRVGTREGEMHRTNPHREGPREVDEMLPSSEGARDGTKEGERRGGRMDYVSQQATDQFATPKKQPQLSQDHNFYQARPTEMRGPPMSTDPPTTKPQFSDPPTQGSQSIKVSSLHVQANHNLGQSLPAPAYSSNAKPQESYHPNMSQTTTFTSSPHTGNLHPVKLQVLTGMDSSPSRRDLQTMTSGTLVTGKQRFLESLQTPFVLQLIDKPGDLGLRKIIIDGSNVAMSHGLGHFFSCRGIALAVQHFWNRGHRQIYVLVPQWRQKRDPMVKEQHFLTELQDLGLLSYTPSREIQGKRITPYDDRFMLKLAQDKDGVIVTNDNLRDLLNESPVWRDIIKKRLLQYTFVEDLFMVPDDPLGRGGPHLDQFLRSQHRYPDPGHHSFAGVASRFLSSNHPRSQTEVLQFRDRTLGGTARPQLHGGWRRGRVEDSAGNGAPQRHGSGRAVDVVRSKEETAQLRDSLCLVFPGQENMVTLVLQSYPTETDINSLSHLILEQQMD